MSDNQEVSSGAPLVEVRALSRRFGRHTALDAVDLAVPKGVVFGLVGENGAGKTTLIRHLLGLFKAQKGTVRVFGLDPVKDPVGVLSRVGYLSEMRELPEWMRIGEFLLYSRSFYPSWDDAYAQQLQSKFELDPKAPIQGLSQGQRAKVALLAALAHRPELLVLDEPSTGLDPIARRDILEAIVRTVAEEGRTILFSSHLLEEVERMSDCVAMMARGKITLCGPMEEIKASHTRLTLRFHEEQAFAPALEGALQLTGEGHEWVALCDGDHEQFRLQAEKLHAQVVEQRGASLEEIFIARAAAGHNFSGGEAPCASARS